MLSRRQQSGSWDMEDDLDVESAGGATERVAQYAFSVSSLMRSDPGAATVQRARLRASSALYELSLRERRVIRGRGTSISRPCHLLTLHD
ncbi:hypothetical protein Tco_0862351 [Tanacetum coccineum]